MMKKLFSLFFVISLTLSACGTATSQPTPPTQTGTPTITPTATQTPTSTITPLPTIPTFTPTFDVSTIVTITPALAKTCPHSNPNLSLDSRLFYEHTEKYFDDQIFNFILEYINAGGSWSMLASEFSDSSKYGRTLGSINEIDLTKDGIKDFVVEMWAGFGVYTCNNGVYVLSLNLNGVVDGPASIVEIKDMNLNGIPEIVSGIKFCSGHCFDMLIFEWDGHEFQNLLGEWQTITSLEEKVIDVNNDGIFELVIEGPFPSMGGYVDYIPIRGQKDTYIWNGTNFSPSRPKFSIPEYRFQAIQDADMDVLDGYFDNALKFYNDAIFNNELKWWSKDRREYEIQLIVDYYNPTKPTPAPEPLENPAEYPSLAAYAYYRIILLHLVQGQEAEAASTYQTLQDTFGSDQYAIPYVEMATAFWEAYQSTQRMYDGCAAAIHYTVEHPEILIPLGSDYHGAQSHIYEPADVCPFR
jgi:hypothetical protein